MINLTSTITLIELVWFLIAIGGLAAAIAGLRDAQQDTQATENNTDYDPYGPRSIMLRRDRRDFWCKAGTFACFTLMGGIVMTQPPPAAGPTAWPSVAFGSLMIVTEMLLGWDVIWERIDRRRIDRLLLARLRSILIEDRHYSWRAANEQLDGEPDPDAGPEGEPHEPVTG